MVMHTCNPHTWRQKGWEFKVILSQLKDNPGFLRPCLKTNRKDHHLQRGQGNLQPRLSEVSFCSMAAPSFCQLDKGRLKKTSNFRVTASGNWVNAGQSALMAGDYWIKEEKEFRLTCPRTSIRGRQGSASACVYHAQSPGFHPQYLLIMMINTDLM